MLAYPYSVKHCKDHSKLLFRCNSDGLPITYKNAYRAPGTYHESSVFKQPPNLLYKSRNRYREAYGYGRREIDARRHRFPHSVSKAVFLGCLGKLLEKRRKISTPQRVITFTPESLKISISIYEISDQDELSWYLVSCQGSIRFLFGYCEIGFSSGCHPNRIFGF